jgi:hypothetical protein
MDNKPNKETATELVPSIVDKVNEHFKVPIYYNNDKIELKANVITDLELVNTHDASCNSIYTFCFNNENDISAKLNEQLVKYYTTDVLFLKDNQKLTKEYVPPETRYTGISANYKSIVDIWNELKLEAGFREKYYYIEWEAGEFLNRSEVFLQFISIYNLFSPVFSLFVPIIILILPFFVLKIKGLPLTINEYITVLKTVAETNAIGKLFTVNFSEITAQEQIYIFVSAAFYVFSIYQNVMVCVRFNNNMRIIHNHFRDLQLYLDNTLASMSNYLKYSSGLTTHEAFNNNLVNKMAILEKINKNIKSISEYSVYNISKFKEIGRIFKYFYELHTDKDYDDAIMYSLGFNGYIDCLNGLQTNIIERKMNYASFITDTKKTVFNKSYYACEKHH